MADGILGNALGAFGFPKTYILTDESGNELTGVYVESETIFTADASSDIRAGKVAATDAGVVTGEAIIPNYETYEGTKIVANGNDFKILLNSGYDYTKFQAIICSFNKNLSDSVFSDKVVINDKVYAVQSTDVVSSIVKNIEDNSIDFGIANTSGKIYLIRYFMCKELY